MRYNTILFSLMLSLSLCSCDKDTAYDLIDETIDEGGQDQGDEEVQTTLLNFLGDSIIDYWDDLSNYFPGYECLNHGWSAKGIDTFLGRVDLKTIEDTECVVEVGTNDMRKVINDGSIDSYVEHYIDVLIALKARHIYLLSLLPRNRAKDGGFDFNSHYPEINNKIQDRAAERMENVTYIPLFELFLKDGHINWGYTYDGLHPNAKGYEVIANEIRKYLSLHHSK